MRNLGIYSLLVLLAFSSCKKDPPVPIDIFPPDITSYVPAVENITAGVIGFVVDESDVPVAGATVVLENNMTITDEYGHFFIENETMNALGTLVKVEKEGFFEGSRRFFPIDGMQSRIKIQLLSKSFDNTFNAASGGNIAVSNGTSIEFSPNSIQTAAGNIYTGTVNVAMKWLDPSANATFDQMPGNLQGVNAEVEQVALSTYGMIAVELQDDAGKALNIAEGSTAEITMPVPTSMLNGAPNEITLWYYHKYLGLWIQESIATLQGDKYVGEVTHFSFWNCDIPHEYTNIEMTFVDDNEIPLNNYFVTLTVVDASNVIFRPSGSGYTDQSGNVSGIIPANVTLLMEIFDACGGVLYSQTIGPFSVDTDLGTITVTGTGINSTTIIGNLLDCSGVPLTDGVVIVEFEGQTIYLYPTTSNFLTTFSICSSTTNVEIVGANLDDLEQSIVLNVPANTTTDLGDISVCGGSQLQNYVLYTIDGVSEVFLNTGTNIWTDTTHVFAIGGEEEYYSSFFFPGTDVGNYQNNAVVTYIFDSDQNWNFLSVDLSTFDVTQYGAVITGSFTGEGENTVTGNIVPISCTFSIEN